MNRTRLHYHRIIVLPAVHPVVFALSIRTTRLRPTPSFVDEGCAQDAVCTACEAFIITTEGYLFVRVLLPPHNPSSINGTPFST